jgi:acetylornithine deacetylase
MAHSAYPELGESAVHKLVEVLGRLLALPLPSLEDVGPSTLNIGQIHGGHAPNVIADKAEAQVLVRLVGDSARCAPRSFEAAAGLAEVDFTLEIPFVRLRAVEGLPTMIAKFTTDIPQLSNWGEPLLLGPGSIHVAHTPFEKLAKKELLEAVELYIKVAKHCFLLSALGAASAGAVACVGRGGVCARTGRGQADPAGHWRGVVPLVPRDGPRVV